MGSTPTPTPSPSPAGARDGTSDDTRDDDACAPLCCPPLTGAVLDEEQAADLVLRLKALADPIRIRLVSLLACTDGGELCACDLPEILGRSQPTVSHHLKQLVEAGLIKREQRGKWAWFRLRPEAMADIRVALGAEPIEPADSTASAGATSGTGSDEPTEPAGQAQLAGA